MKSIGLKWKINCCGIFCNLWEGSETRKICPHPWLPQNVADTEKDGITPSMPRRGNCYDNTLSENFFGILKTEWIYLHKPETFKEANEMMDRYIRFYNHERIQYRTDVAPLTLCHSA